MAEITMEITVKGLSPADAQELAEFVQARLIDKRGVIYPSTDMRYDPATNACEDDAPVETVLPSVPVPASTGIEDRPHPNSQGMIEKMYPLHTVPGYVAPPAPVTVGNVPVTVPSAVPIISPTPVTASSGERDSKGVIWDARFHAGTKRKNANGTWSKAKGCDDVALAAHVLACKVEPIAATEPQKIVTTFDMPIIPTPAPEQTPYGELVKLWTDLCIANAVTPQLAAWMEIQGGNPMDTDPQGGNLYSRNPAHCHTVINVLLPFKR